MSLTRRKALAILAGALPAARSLRMFGQTPDFAKGPFQPTRDSLSTYRVPEWFRDAKFGIWAHWGPQSSVEAGDWYARNMYIPSEPQYKYHVEHYGPQSKFGYKDLIPLWKGVDKYQPDMIYSDGHIPFQDWGLKLVAEHYNVSAKRNGGKVEAIYTSKKKEDSDAGLCVFDRERGVLDEIWPHSWQTDTCIGNWHYARNIEYKTPKTVVDMLVDIVSKNGNLMLNFPLPNNGMLDDRELKVLSGITDWIAVNGEAIFASRPWKISGQATAPATAAQDTMFNESKRKPFTAEDIRFTTKGQTLYAFLMGWPEPAKGAVISPLATGSKYAPGKIERVELLGFPGKLKWTRDESGLRVQMPEQKPSEHAVALRVSGKGLT